MKVKRYSVFSGTGLKKLETFSYGVYSAPLKQTRKRVKTNCAVYTEEYSTIMHNVLMVFVLYLT